MQKWVAATAAASTQQLPSEKTPTQPQTSCVSKFERLEYREESPSLGGQFRTHREMMLQKVEQGRQPECHTKQRDKSVGWSEKEAGPLQQPEKVQPIQGTWWSRFLERTHRYGEEDQSRDRLVYYRYFEASLEARPTASILPTRSRQVNSQSSRSLSEINCHTAEF